MTDILEPIIIDCEKTLTPDGTVILTVSGGELTQDSVKRIQAFIDAQARGDDNFSRFIILEATSTFENGPPPVISIFKLQEQEPTPHDDISSTPVQAE